MHPVRPGAQKTYDDEEESIEEKAETKEEPVEEKAETKEGEDK